MRAKGALVCSGIRPLATLRSGSALASKASLALVSGRAPKEGHVPPFPISDTRGVLLRPVLIGEVAGRGESPGATRLDPLSFPPLTLYAFGADAGGAHESWAKWGHFMSGLHWLCESLL